MRSFLTGKGVLPIDKKRTVCVGSLCINVNESLELLTGCRGFVRSSLVVFLAKRSMSKKYYGSGNRL